MRFLMPILRRDEVHQITQAEFLFREKNKTIRIERDIDLLIDIETELHGEYLRDAQCQAITPLSQLESHTANDTL